MSNTPVNSEPKLLAKGHGDIQASKAKLLAILLMTGLWDSLSVLDREAWCERGEIMDTYGGRLLFKTFRNLGLM